MKLLSALVFLFVSTQAFATNSYKAKVDVTTSGSIHVMVTKEVNVYGEAAKELYDFLDEEPQPEAVQSNWIYKKSSYLTCGKDIKTQNHVCTIYVTPEGLGL